MKQAVCKKCGETRPIAEFPPPQGDEKRREWITHHWRCKECVNEAVKKVQRATWMEKFIALLPLRTTRNIRSELELVESKMRAIDDELKRRARKKLL